MPRACAISAMRATCDTTPSQDGSTSRIARASGSAVERGLDRLDRMAERDAARLVDGGSDPHRPRAGEHEARRDRLVRAARDDHGLALGGDREAERLVGMREPLPVKRQRSAPNAAAASRSACARMPCAAAQVVRPAVPRRVVGEQRVAAGERGVALVARRRERRRRLAQERSDRVGERSLGGRHPRDAMRTGRGAAAARSCHPRSRRGRPWRAPP